MKLSDIRQLTVAVGLALATTAAAQNPDFDEGRAHIKAQQWEEALRSFETAAKAREERDQALYWQAYALEKLARDAEMRARVRELERRHPNSRWLDDARALSVSGESADGDLDPELKLYALSRLMERDPDRALPLLREFISTSSDTRIRRDALFVLGMSDASEAKQEIARLATQSTDASLQIAAIEALGTSDGSQTEDLLRSVYQQARSADVQRAVAQAAMIQESESLLREIALDTSNPEVRIAAIQGLGITESTAALRELYPQVSDSATRRQILQSMAMAQDAESLQSVLRDEDDATVRRTAIESIALLDDSQGAETILTALYDADASVEERSAILNALVILDDSDALAIRVASEESNPELQRQAVQVLGILENTDALKTLMQRTSDPDVQGQIIQALGLAGDSESVIDALKSNDEILRRAALQALPILDEVDMISPVLSDLYPTASAEDKQQILSAMMVAEDVDGLVGLLQVADDRDEKRQIVRMLSLVDSDAADDFLFSLLEEDSN